MSGLRYLSSAVVALTLIFSQTSVLDAQTLGTFRWNMAPFCNVVTLTVAQVGTAFTAVGSDDQCGLQPATPVDGTLILTSGTTVTGTLFTTGANNADPVFSKVTISTNGLSGSWLDSSGNSGSFLFNPATAPGVPRTSRGELWGYVVSSGTGFHATSGGLTVTHPATGEYCVALAKRSAHKAAQVTLADPGGSKIVSVGTGHGSSCNPLVTATQDAVPVYIRTTAGAAIDGNFTIVIPAK